MSQAQLGSRISFSADLVRRVETADRYPSRRFVEFCDAALSTGGALIRLWPRLDEERRQQPAPPRPSSSCILPHDREVAAANLIRRVPLQPGLLDRAALDWLTSESTLPSPTAMPAEPSAWVLREDVLAVQTTLRMYRELDHTLGAGRCIAGCSATSKASSTGCWPPRQQPQ